MNKYQCQVCGAVSYSAASQENLKDDSCIECDGRVEMAEGEVNAGEVVTLVDDLRQDVYDYDQGKTQNFFAVTRRSKNAANLIESLQAQLAASQRRAQDARNELCLKCGRYREAHNGACNGCRWKE